MGSLIPPFWTSDDVSSGFHSHNGQSYFHLAEAYVLYVPHHFHLKRFAKNNSIQELLIFKKKFLYSETVSKRQEQIQKNLILL